MDWDDPFLKQVAPFISNGFVGTATPFYAKADDIGAVKYLYGTNVRSNEIDPKRLRYISADFHVKQAKTELREGDLLTVQSGHIGTTAMVPAELDGANCHALIISRLNQKKAFPAFLCQYLNSEIGKARLRGLEVGSTILHINTKDLKKFRVPLPPLAEQKKIAEILSTWDRAIETAEALLATARTQKRALMQTLLTGKRRFPEFEGQKWREVRFEEVFDRVRRKNTVGNENTLTISGQDGLVSQQEYFTKRVAAADLSGYTLLVGGDFAYNKSYSAGYPMGAIKMLPDGQSGVVSSLYLCFALGDPNAHSREFFRHFFEAGCFNHEIYKIAQEGARNHGLLNVSVTDFFRAKIRIPDREEQCRIAESINLAEREEARDLAVLEKLRTEKKALMQQLLTGKRRVQV